MTFARGVRMSGDEETHMANMSKNDVLSAVAGSAGCTKGDAEAVIEAFFGCVESAAKAGDAVAWPGVGKFSRSDRAARQGRNPQTGETIQIAASSSVKFTAAKALKDRMNG
ncbi:MAG: HU family DNA-binding protein [Acidimicrobiales bacterium]|jgi:DNA-binding protein HU-beta|nr:HU family DNA-binding protein [Actinomycetota bacterium]MEC9089605.1 HU family DNA-binding protein [Actinomycetota bacterium]